MKGSIYEKQCLKLTRMQLTGQQVYSQIRERSIALSLRISLFLCTIMILIEQYLVVYLTTDCMLSHFALSTKAASFLLLVMRKLSS